MNTIAAFKTIPAPTLVALVCLSMLGCAPARGQAVMFADDFDDGASAADWAVFSQAGDYTAEFAFDYSTRGIPPAPNTTGDSTIGLRFTVNNNDGVPARDAVSAYPVGPGLSGDRTLKFDMWLNYNGGPGGGSGSTEFATFGLYHAGDTVCSADNSASDGFWFAVSGEGGDTADYRAYRNATLLADTAGGFAAGSLNHSAAFYQTLFPSPPFETTGAPGKQWVEVEVGVRGGVVEWRLNGMLVALRLDTTLSAGNLMLGYMDTYASIAGVPEDNFVVYDNVRVEGPDCDENGVPDDVDLGAGDGIDCNANAKLDACESIVAGDFDADGDVDAVDAAAILAVIGGPDRPPAGAGPSCVGAVLDAFDFDQDTSIDLADFAAFQAAGTPGPFSPREAGVPGGSQFLAEVVTLTQSQREDRILAEILGGNVPGFLREFVPIDVAMEIGGSVVAATYFVSPDYLSIGRDDDFVRVPMTPLIAQPIADDLGCLLPTRKMVDDIYAQSAVQLAPAPISPTTVDITLATTHYRHHQMVEAQRAGQPLGLLVGGIKKDVVITPQLATHPGRVAIYGWHRLNGIPIQPLYLGHVDWYVDYSHGIRLVADRMIVNGVETTVSDVLADAELHVLLSDEGVISDPGY